jgi:hypothetical protein
MRKTRLKKSKNIFSECVLDFNFAPISGFVFVKKVKFVVPYWTVFLATTVHQTKTGAIFPQQESDIYDNRELNRRSEVKRSRVLLRILYNGKEVTTSQAKVLGQDFVIPVGHIFPIQILQWPDTGGLRIQLLEGSGGLRNSLLAEVEIPLCDPETGLDKERLTAFSYCDGGRYYTWHTAFAVLAGQLYAL